MSAELKEDTVSIAPLKVETQKTKACQPAYEDKHHLEL